MDKRFTILSFISELILMHAKGDSLTLEEMDKLSGTTALFDKLEEIGFNNYEFKDEKAKEEHFKTLRPIVADLDLKENQAITMDMMQDCGLLYIAKKLLDTKV